MILSAFSFAVVLTATALTQSSPVDNTNYLYDDADVVLATTPSGELLQFAEANGNKAGAEPLYFGDVYNICAELQNACITGNQQLNEQKRAFLMTDAGYGGRIEEANAIARSSLARKLFGISGPGKRSVDTVDAQSADIDYVCALSQMCSTGPYQEGILKIVESKCSVPGSRRKRAIGITDAGYGSRVNEAAELARSTLGRHVFGVFGPGKRSISHPDALSVLCDSFPRSRRGVDFGYGSRVNAGSWLADRALTHQVFGSDGPGKRSLLTSRSFCFYHPDVCEDTLVAKRPWRSDFGYGSRVNDGANMARSAVLSDLYGTYGPGR